MNQIYCPFLTANKAKDASLYVCMKSYSVTKQSNIKYKNDKPYVALSNTKYFVKIMKTG